MIKFTTKILIFDFKTNGNLYNMVEKQMFEARNVKFASPLKCQTNTILVKFS